MPIALILASVLLAAVAQVTLKAGMNQVRDGHGVVGADVASIRAVAGTPLVWLGLFLFGISALVWLGVLSRTSLSFAYPFASLTYVVIVLVDAFVLDESVPALRWAGVLLIVAGIVAVSRTSEG
ncbi:MAG: EamA family transporter [Actinomycetota bacterium]